MDNVLLVQLLGCTLSVCRVTVVTLQLANSTKVKASRLVANKNDIRSESVAFNGVNFRASKSLRVGIRGDFGYV